MFLRRERWKRQWKKKEGEEVMLNWSRWEKERIEGKEEKRKGEEKCRGSFLFALRVNPFPTLEVITARYIVGSARGTINRLQRSFFSPPPFAQSSSPPFASTEEKIFKKKKKRKERRIHSMNFRSDCWSSQRPDFSRRPSRHEITPLAVSGETGF